MALRARGTLSALINLPRVVEPCHFELTALAADAATTVIFVPIVVFSVPGDDVDEHAVQGRHLLVDTRDDTRQREERSLLFETWEISRGPGSNKEPAGVSASWSYSPASVCV
jgi:hypothetical protein